MEDNIDKNGRVKDEDIIAGAVAGAYAGEAIIWACDLSNKSVALSPRWF